MERMQSAIRALPARRELQRGLQALAAAGAILLILEMDRPLQGLMKISTAPMHAVLDSLGR